MFSALIGDRKGIWSQKTAQSNPSWNYVLRMTPHHPLLLPEKDCGGMMLKRMFWFVLREQMEN